MPLPSFSLSLPSKAPAGAIHHSREWIPGGDAGTAATIARMRDMVDAGKHSEEIRQEFISPILHGQMYPNRQCAAKDYLCYVRNFFEFCRDKILYVYDPAGIELVEHPLLVLRKKMADCDSVCVALCTLCESVGLPCRFVTIRSDAANPDVFTHVYCECKVPRKGWVPMDATMSHPFGWAPDPKYPRKNWPASSTSEGGQEDNVSGLNGLGLSPFSIPQVQLAPESNAQGAMPGDGWQWQIQPAIIPANDIDDIVDDAMSPNSTQTQIDAPDTLLEGLGEEATPEVEMTMMKVVTGRMAPELQAARTSAFNDQTRAYATLAAAQRITDPSTRAQAVSYAQQGIAQNLASLQTIQEAIRKYHDLVVEIQTATGGAVRPPQLGAFGALPAIVVYGIVLSASAYVILSAVANLVGTFKGQQSASRGFIDQAASLAESTGQVIKNTGDAIVNIADASTKVALVGAALFGGYLLVKHFGPAAKKKWGIA